MHNTELGIPMHPLPSGLLAGARFDSHDAAMNATMLIARRHLIAASSIALILIVGTSLATSFEIHAPMIWVQGILAHKITQNGNDFNRKAAINGTSFDMVDVLNGTATISAKTHALESVKNANPKMKSGEDAAEASQTPSTYADAVSIGETAIKATSTAPAMSKPASNRTTLQSPIRALIYDGDGGPKHCRGQLIRKLELPRPVSAWKNGTCVNLPLAARCGIFFASKSDNCEADLYNAPSCTNSAQSYINTVVFMPEERPVGGLWRSMSVRCGMDVPEAGLIDPSVLGSLLKKPGGKAAST